MPPIIPFEAFEVDLATDDLCTISLKVSLGFPNAVRYMGYPSKIQISGNFLILQGAQPIEDLPDLSRWNSGEIIELSFARIQTDLTQTDSHGAHASGVQAASFPIHHFLQILSRASLFFGFIPP